MQIPINIFACISEDLILKIHQLTIIRTNYQTWSPWKLNEILFFDVSKTKFRNEKTRSNNVSISRDSRDKRTKMAILD